MPSEAALVAARPGEAERGRPGPGRSGREDAPVVRLEVFEGPLDLLLERARANRVEVARIPLAALIDQFVAAMEAAGSGASLARRPDWLVMVVGFQRSSSTLP